MKIINRYVKSVVTFNTHLQRYSEQFALHHFTPCKPRRTERYESVISSLQLTEDDIVSHAVEATSTLSRGGRGGRGRGVRGGRGTRGGRGGRGGKGRDIAKPPRYIHCKVH